MISKDEAETSYLQQRWEVDQPEVIMSKLLNFTLPKRKRKIHCEPSERRSLSEQHVWLWGSCMNSELRLAFRCMAWPLDLTPMSRMSFSVSNSNLFPVMWFSLNKSA